MAERSVAGVVAAFVAGYVAGARGGRDAFEEVRAAVATIRSSPEAGAALAALRSHAAGALREAAERLATGGAPAVSLDGLRARLRRLVGEGPTSPAS